MRESGMINRNILKSLNNWKKSSNRKPLIIRGARQTGKTYAVNMFSKSFDNYVYINLEKEDEKAVFENGKNLQQIIQGIELLKEQNLTNNNTLLFIDEIQSSSKAIQMLRYFYDFFNLLKKIFFSGSWDFVIKKFF